MNNTSCNQLKVVLELEIQAPRGKQWQRGVDVTGAIGIFVYKSGWIASSNVIRPNISCGTWPNVLLDYPYVLLLAYLLVRHLYIDCKPWRIMTLNLVTEVGVDPGECRKVWQPTLANDLIITPKDLCLVIIFLNNVMS